MKVENDDAVAGKRSEKRPQEREGKLREKRESVPKRRGRLENGGGGLAGREFW